MLKHVLTCLPSYFEPLFVNVFHLSLVIVNYSAGSPESLASACFLQKTRRKAEKVTHCGVGECFFFGHFNMLP